MRHYIKLFCMVLVAPLLRGLEYTLTCIKWYISFICSSHHNTTNSFYPYLDKINSNITEFYYNDTHLLLFKIIVDVIVYDLNDHMDQMKHYLNHRNTRMVINVQHHNLSIEDNGYLQCNYIWLLFLIIYNLSLIFYNCWILFYLIKCLCSLCLFMNSTIKYSRIIIIQKQVIYFKI